MSSLLASIIKFEEQAASMGEIAKNTENLSDLGEELQKISQCFVI